MNRFLWKRIRAILLFFALPAGIYAATIGGITRTGNSMPNGSYRWSYTCRINSAEKMTEQATVGITVPPDCPFQVTGLPKTLSVDTQAGHVLEFSINVPASFIQEPVDLTTFNPKLGLKTASGAQDSKTFAVRGPLPEHPRLFVRKNELADIKRRMASQDFYDIKPVYNLQKNYNTDGKVETDRPDEKIGQKMEALALEYMTDPVAKKSLREGSDHPGHQLPDFVCRAPEHGGNGL